MGDSRGRSSTSVVPKRPLSPAMPVVPKRPSIPWAPKSSSTVLVGQARTITEDFYFGFAYRSDIDKFLEYVKQGDNDAARSFVLIGLLANLCTKFNKGEIVYVMGVDYPSLLVKVRRKGEVREYWTPILAVEEMEELEVH